MFKHARYFRWGIIFITVAVEALAFWFGSPRPETSSTIGAAIISKLGHPMSWTWVGWASLSMAWLWAELAFIFYSNGRRSRALLKRSDHEKLVYDTGVHWLVLLRDIHINRLNDGKKDHLEESLFPKDIHRSFAWHAIWWPIVLAITTLLYFVGWAAWSIKSVPQISTTWSTALQSAVQEKFTGPASVIADLLGAFLVNIPIWLEQFAALARQNIWLTLGSVFMAWFVLRLGARLTKRIPIAPILLNTVGRLTILIGFFAILSTRLFDWLGPSYNLVPHHGLVAMGFFPLTLASAFYFPHILFWTSWRYAIIRDKETHDATLMTLGGVFNNLRQRINLQRIVDTDIYQHWWQRLVDIGDIDLKEMGGGEAERIRHVYGPHKLLDEIQNAIREGKKRSSQQSEFDVIDQV